MNQPCDQKRKMCKQKGIVMRLTLWIRTLLSILAMSMCAYSQDVHYNYDRGAAFGSYRTYQWVDLPGAVKDQLINADIKRSIDEQLSQKGLTRVEANGNLNVGYRAAIDLQSSVYLMSTGVGGWGDRTIEGQTSTIPLGMLMVDLYDPARNQLVWRGDATKVIDLNKNPDKNYRHLQKVMAKLFKNYPPQSRR